MKKLDPRIAASYVAPSNPEIAFLMPTDELLLQVRELTALARAHADAADASTELHPELIAELRRLGLFKLWVPQRYGGRELDLPQTLRIYEAAAAIDGSLGWAVMIGSGGGLFAAYLEPDAAQTLFASPSALVAGSGAPSGRAERVGDGYRASGRWRFASGARYASVFTANCIITSDGAPILDSNGKPLIRAMSFQPADVTIVPTWNATGMRGTGSHDFEVHDAIVPASHTFSVFTDPPRESGALYRLPFDVLTHLPIAAVGSGIAQHALEAFAQLAANKPLRYEEARLHSDAAVRAVYATSHARWLSVHLALHALATRTWDTAMRGAPLDPQEHAQTKASSAFFLDQLLIAVGDLVRLAGMNGVLHDQPLARAWRDLQTLAAHVSVSPLFLSEAGAVLLQAATTSSVG